MAVQAEESTSVVTDTCLFVLPEISWVPTEGWFYWLVFSVVSSSYEEVVGQGALKCNILNKMELLII